MMTKQKPLIDTNPYLKDPAQRKRLIRRSVRTSSAVEGIKNNSPFLIEDYTEESLSEGWDIIKQIAEDKYNLTFYSPNMEIVSFEDMLHIYTGSLPISYDHWSFGKSYQDLYKNILRI